VASTTTTRSFHKATATDGKLQLREPFVEYHEDKRGETDIS